MISKMPCWFYDRKALLSTPSIQDGIDHETECQYRREGAHLIIQIGSQMELGYNTLATGIVYFHRFYMFHSFKTFSPYITACCCLFLAGKVEETPKKSKDIIKIAKTFLTEDKLLTLGENPREEVMTMEKILLQTMKFDLKVRHPYYFLVNYAKCLKGNRRKMHKMVQMAWTFINDSLSTTLSIQWEPEIIAIAVMYLAGKLVKLKIAGWSHRKPSQTNWWEIFVEDLSIQVVEDICHQVLDLYSPLSRYQVSPPKVIKVEPQNSVFCQLDSFTFNTDIKIDVKDPRVENDVSSITSFPAISLKDPRLESGSVFVKNQFHMNTLPLVTSSNGLSGSTIFTPSPATLTIPQSMFEKGFNNVDNLQSIENRSVDFRSNNSNDYSNSRLTRRRRFGCTNNNNRNYSKNQLMGNRGFRNYVRSDNSGYCRFRRRSFGNNNHDKGDDHIENRPLGNRGFENANSNNNRYNDNKSMSNQGFSNVNGSYKYNDNWSMRNQGFKKAHDNETKPLENRDCGNINNNDEAKPLWSRGFGNANKNNGAKPLGNRGFRNADNYNNEYINNDSRPKMRCNRGNRFQRPGNYRRRFNNNYENDRYFRDDANRDGLKDIMGDVPDNIIDKQRFYRSSNENVNNADVEEECWD